MHLFKSLVIVSSITLTSLQASAGATSSSASASAEVPPLRGVICGKVASADGVSGAVFATADDARMAMLRGADGADVKNPFVSTVGCIDFRTGEDSGTRAVVTVLGARANQALLIGCHHTFAALDEALRWDERKVRKSLHIRFGERGVTGFAGDLMVRSMPGHDVALAVMQMTEGHWPEGPYLPFAEGVADHSEVPALAVSYSDVGCAGVEAPTSIDAGKQHRAVSYQKLRPTGHSDGRVRSILEGELPEYAAARAAVLTMRGAALEAKSLYYTSDITFPAPTKSVEALSAALGFGASGTPAVVKMGGTFRLAALLTSGAALPKAAVESTGGYLVLEPDSFRKTAWVNRFDDLSSGEKRAWFLAQIRDLGF